MILDGLAQQGNVAQFVAFEPSPGGAQPTFSRLRDRAANTAPVAVPDAIAALLAKSDEGAVNVRSYSPDDPRSREFVYGIRGVNEAVAVIARLSASGLHTIANETIDIGDGGVSGVLQGDVLEFAPDDTPRCVERPGTARFPAARGLALLTAIYGFAPTLTPAPGVRIEFSIHPRRRGWRREHTLLWEREEGLVDPQPALERWPNRFSALIGDKAFGLLVADRLGLPVPRTMVIGRRVAPFSFGTATGSGETWLRTCPHEPQPGLFTTLKGWTDPFALLATEDPAAEYIASVLRQDAVVALHSGAALVGSDGDLVVEGVGGEGDRFMLGSDGPQPLDTTTVARVQATHAKLAAALGPVRFEWVDDGERAWVVQLHLGTVVTTGSTIVPGAAARWVAFDPASGLPALRTLLADLGTDDGVEVGGGAGTTSHIADILRKAGRPARIADAVGLG